MSKIINNWLNKIQKNQKELEIIKRMVIIMNYSTLVLTKESGLVMVGMLYMNNIGSLLTRLGIQIFSGSTGNVVGMGRYIGEVIFFYKKKTKR